MIEYVSVLAVLVLLNVVLAVSFNLVLGYGGLVSIAHPIFFALGAYASGLLARDLGVPVPLAIVAGGLLAMLSSVALSVPALRVSGDYMVITSLGFQLALVHIITNVEFTGAAGGLTGIPSAFDGAMRSPMAVVAAALLAVACIAAVRWLMHGPYGRAVTAMRNDEQALASLGRSPMAIKVMLFALACGMAGIAGGFYAHHFLYLTPEQFSTFASTALLTMVVVGGAATTWGPVLGAVLVTLLPEVIRFIDMPIAIMAPLQGVLFSLLVLVFLYLRPQGLLGGSRAGGGVAAWHGARAERRTARGAKP
ncbi:branched-chain amino acid ABC transporter permease [uncultured Pseudacidovorax sp.]|uniref:branched-chain amino acid ABC transporter permease n=1 Tax=uncultured Pseudacidovorax sp. TaxID=679313 RepID=UPI0025F3F131|nr:branched-chain amino acid ABC transporter permease [uncultured Pseudacidovorax sp.]